MKTKVTTFRLTSLAAALLGVFGTAVADDDEIRQLTEPDSYLSVGVGNWSSDRLQQGMYDGMSESGVYGLLDADVVRRDEATGTWLSMKATNLGLDTRAFEAEWLRQGDVGAFLNYRRITRENPLEIYTGLQGIGSTDMTISGAGDAALPFREVKLGTTRDQVQVGLTKNLLKGLDFKLRFKNEEKDGTRNWGLGSDALFLVEPIDSTTQQLDMILEYTTERLQLAGGYSGSWYTNDNKMVMGLVNGADQPGSAQRPNPTPLSLPLDNQAHQFFVNAGYSFDSKTRGTLKLSRIVATQDEGLPSYNLPPPNNPFVGAPSSLDGKVVTSLAEVALSSNPTSDLALNGSLRYYDVDDQTPLAGFVGNNETGEVTVHNTPQSYKTLTGKLEASYRLQQRLKLYGGVDLMHQDRSVPLFVEERYVPYRREVNESTYWVKLRQSMSDTVNGAITFEHITRDGSTYVPPHDPDIFNLISPTNIADRDRNRLRLSLDWAPHDTFDMQFKVEGSRDDYSHTYDRPYGLVDGDAYLFSVDARYSFSDAVHLTGWYSHDTTSARQLSGRWDRVTKVFEMEKEANLKDKGDSIGLALRGDVNEKLQLGADLQWTRTSNSYDESLMPSGLGGLQEPYPTSGGVTAVPLPDIESTLTRLSLFARYKLHKNADMRFDLIHERWKTTDWTWTFADGSPFRYGTATDGTVVTIQPKESSTFVGVRYIYKFK